MEENSFRESTTQIDLLTTRSRYLHCPRITFEAFNEFRISENMYASRCLLLLSPLHIAIPHHSDNFALLGIQHHEHIVN